MKSAATESHGVRSGWRRLGLHVALLLAVWLQLATGGCGGSVGVGGWAYVLAPEEVHYGASYSGWSARWWQWTLEQAAATNPGYDHTGAEALNGQIDPVWFLCGIWSDGLNPSSGTEERSVTISSTIALFFPIINTEWDNVDCLPPGWVEHSVTQLREGAYEAVASAVDILCEVDGDRIVDSPDLAGAVRWRATSPVFSALMPDGNIYARLCGTTPFAHTVEPCVSDGIWVMLSPMPVGQHTIHFAATFPGNAVAAYFHLDITYHVTVTP